jgi:hypothetical protein
MKKMEWRKAEAEKLKRAKLKKATTVASGKYPLGGVEKTRRHKPPPVTLASPRTLQKLIDEN